MNQVITTHHFMAVETRLLSRPYVSCLTEIEMRKLLHFYLRMDFYKGKTKLVITTFPNSIILLEEIIKSSA